MSNKLNVCSVFSGHLSTLRSASTSKLLLGDLFTFYGIPFLIACLCMYFKIDFTEKVIEVFVNSSAIFTGLLLNLLVLVYDQKAKIPTVTIEDPQWERNQSKHTLIQELYYNISYSTLISVLILVLSVLHLCFDEYKSDLITLKYITIFPVDYTVVSTTPLLVFSCINLLLTILMVIKRIYSLLSTTN